MTEEERKEKLLQFMRKNKGLFSVGVGMSFLSAEEKRKIDKEFLELIKE